MESKNKKKSVNIWENVEVYAYNEITSGVSNFWELDLDKVSFGWSLIIFSWLWFTPPLIPPPLTPFKSERLLPLLAGNSSSGIHLFMWRRNSNDLRDGQKKIKKTDFYIEKKYWIYWIEQKKIAYNKIWFCVMKCIH